MELEVGDVVEIRELVVRVRVEMHAGDDIADWSNKSGGKPPPEGAPQTLGFGTRGVPWSKRRGGPSHRLYCIREITSAFYRPSPWGRAQARRSAAMDTHREVVDEEELVVDMPILYLTG